VTRPRSNSYPGVDRVPQPIHRGATFTEEEKIMSVDAITKTPNKLLTSLKALIADGSISVWSIDSEGDFLHSGHQVRDVCCFKTEVQEGRLRFVRRWFKDALKTDEASAELHAHAVRMLMIHGGSLLTSIEVPQP
jgi:hypothetical protein